MKNLITILLTGALLYTNGGIAQEANKNTDNPGGKNIQPFIGIGIFPLPTPLYASISAGFEIGQRMENKLLYGTLYAKAGNFNIENMFHSYFIEMNIILKRIDFKNKSVLSIETPVWLGWRNFVETFVEERHQQHDYTHIQIGSGMDVKYHLHNRLSLFSKIGIGYGPRYNFAGDFNFSSYRFEKYSWLPIADLGIRFDL